MVDVGTVVGREESKLIEAAKIGNLSALRELLSVDVDLPDVNRREVSGQRV